MKKMICNFKVKEVLGVSEDAASVLRIIEEVADMALIHRDALFTETTHKAAKARALIFYRIRKETSVTFAQIAKIFSVTPGNVANMIKAHHDAT